MLCWICQKQIPKGAEFCPHCEAEVRDAPSAEEVAAVADILAELRPEVLQELSEAFHESESGEDFVNRIMVGDCPKCSSSNTTDCENDPEIDDPCVGRCMECSLLWCLDCGLFYKNASFISQHDCPFWKEMGLDDDDMDDDK